MPPSGRLTLDVTPRRLALTTAAGVVLGVAYTLSPLMVWFMAGFVLLCRRAIRDLSDDECRLVLVVFIVATALRLAVVAGLFVSTDHWSMPFGSLFGDEDYFKRRSLWLRSMALDVDISIADRIYAIDEYSDTSYLYVLAFLQVLVGAAPYGVHVFSIFLYLAGAVVTYRFVRRAFGPAPALLAIVLILFLPTLFLWSVSALRESLHFLLAATALVGGVEIIRANTGRSRIAWAGAMLGALYTLGDLRAGSRQVIAASLVIGIAMTLVLHRRRWLIAAIAAAIVVTAIALSRPAVQQNILQVVRTSALNHQGHVFTPGLHYKLLEPKFYLDRRISEFDAMSWAEAARFVIRALVAFIVVPLPWQAETVTSLVYLPEHVVWLALAALFPFGVWAGWKYSPASTSIVTAYVLLMGAGIAVRSGNVGTLVRHRGLVLPFIICLSAVAVCHLLARVAAARVRRPSRWPGSIERTI